jgi:hypothetical protein
MSTSASGIALRQDLVDIPADWLQYSRGHVNCVVEFQAIDVIASTPFFFPTQLGRWGS